MGHTAFLSYAFTSQQLSFPVSSFLSLHLSFFILRRSGLHMKTETILLWNFFSSSPWCSRLWHAPRFLFSISSSALVFEFSISQEAWLFWACIVLLFCLPDMEIKPSRSFVSSLESSPKDVTESSSRCHSIKRDLAQCFRCISKTWRAHLLSSSKPFKYIVLVQKTCHKIHCKRIISIKKQNHLDFYDVLRYTSPKTQTPQRPGLDIMNRGSCWDSCWGLGHSGLCMAGCVV